mmetsp:Transcript_3325/g.3890  ORF Transcript_3325/g.3890 Transcript_3325/m.3890 type:complete len:84 (-) Transcript_3325:205-456(-)
MANAGMDVNQVPALQRKTSKRVGGLPGKIAQAPPEGFYCYYPELFDKPNCQIFTITKVQKPTQPSSLQQPQDLQNGATPVAPN